MREPHTRQLPFVFEFEHCDQIRREKCPWHGVVVVFEEGMHEVPDRSLGEEKKR